MKKRENRILDRFAFFAALPIVPDDRINRTIDQELRGAPESRRDAVRAIEDFLSRYFAPGCRQAA
jgi:hypothetical protein